jgi:uncharacterized protein YjeT (DUF2065 family)
MDWIYESFFATCLISSHKLTWGIKIWWRIGYLAYVREHWLWNFHVPDSKWSHSHSLRVWLPIFVPLTWQYVALENTLGFVDSSQYRIFGLGDMVAIGVLLLRWLTSLWRKWTKTFYHPKGSTHECHWFALLRKHCSNSFSWCIGFNSEDIVEVGHC